jgi:hypothetical protein
MYLSFLKIKKNKQVFSILFFLFFLIGKAYPEEKKRISKPFVKKASSVSK